MIQKQQRKSLKVQIGGKNQNEKVVVMNNTKERKITIDFTNDKRKTLLKIGYIRIYLENKFNWLQKKMFKFLLGIEIESVDDSNVKD